MFGWDGFNFKALSWANKVSKYTPLTNLFANEILNCNFFLLMPTSYLKIYKVLLYLWGKLSVVSLRSIIIIIIQRLILNPFVHVNEFIDILWKLYFFFIYDFHFIINFFYYPKYCIPCPSSHYFHAETVVYTSHYFTPPCFFFLAFNYSIST